MGWGDDRDNLASFPEYWKRLVQHERNQQAYLWVWKVEKILNSSTFDHVRHSSGVALKVFEGVCVIF